MPSSGSFSHPSLAPTLQVLQILGNRRRQHTAPLCSHHRPILDANPKTLFQDIDPEFDGHHHTLLKYAEGSDIVHLHPHVMTGAVRKYAPSPAFRITVERRRPGEVCGVRTTTCSYIQPPQIFSLTRPSFFIQCRQQSFLPLPSLEGNPGAEDPSRRNCASIAASPVTHCHRR